MEMNNDPGKIQQFSARFQEICREFRILNEEKIAVNTNDIEIDVESSYEEEDRESLGFQEIVYI